MVTFFRKRKRRQKARVRPEGERQTVHEYRNFFTYNGERQTAEPFGNDVGRTPK